MGSNPFASSISSKECAEGNMLSVERRSLQQAELGSFDRGLASRPYAEFPEDIVHMCLDRTDGEHERACDLGVRGVCRKEAEHLAFALGQGLETGHRSRGSLDR